MYRPEHKKPFSKLILNRLRFSFLRRGLDSGPDLVDRAPAERIAVLVPHPDDEVIGCGGTLYKHTQAGETVTTIYLTDGGKGNQWCLGPSPELIRTRRLEAEEASRVLGITNLVFLDYSDGGLAPSEPVVKGVFEALQAARPQCIFLPFFLDDHPDHVATNLIFAALAPQLKGKMQVFAYEVWTPLPPNRIVDISAVVSVKEEAIHKHVSQMNQVDYAGGILGLNRYRSMSAASGHGFFEAFFAADIETYAKLVQKILRP